MRQTMEPEALWESVVRVIKHLDVKRTEPMIRGDFIIRDEEDLAALKICIAATKDVRCQIVSGEEEDTLTIGQAVTLELSPRRAVGIITSDVGTLLNAPAALIAQPKRFLLLDSSLTHGDETDEDHPLTKYRLVLKLIELLKQSAAYLETNDPTLVFIHEGKYEIPVVYSAENLSTLSTSQLTKLIDILPEDVHSKQRATILAEVIVGMTKHLSRTERFRHLLAHSGEIQKGFEEGYRLFVAGFSYEKIKDQVEAARVEYIGKIHKALSDIQNQLLGIPVATIIVATQMKDSQKVGYEFWVNTSVLLGAWVFVILMIFLLNNQSQTLGVLQEEIKRQKRLLVNEYAAIADSFNATFEEISKRADSQKRILVVIKVLVLLGLVMSHIVYFTLTAPAYTLLTNLMK